MCYRLLLAMGKHGRKRPAASNSQKLHQFFKKPKTVQNLPKSDSKNDSVGTSASVTSLSDNSARSSTLKPASFVEDTHFVVSESSSSALSLIESPVCVASEPNLLVHASSESSTSVSGKDLELPAESNSQMPNQLFKKPETVQSVPQK